MDIFKNLIHVSSNNYKKHEFFDRVNDIQKMIGCTKEDCGISLF